MARNFTYKQKFYSILFLAFLLLIATYKKTYKHILEARTQIDNLSEKLKKIDNSNVDIVLLKNANRNLDYIIGGQSKQPNKVQQNILDFITKSGSDIKILIIKDTHIIIKNEFKIYSNILEVEGSYFELIELLYKIEKEFTESKIVSMNFSVTRNYTRNSRKLTMNIIFQNYEKNN